MARTQGAPDADFHLRPSTTGRDRRTDAAGLGDIHGDLAGSAREGLRGRGGRVLGSLAEDAEAARRRASATRGRLSADSPLLGGPLTSDAGAEDPRPQPAGFDPDEDVLSLPSPLDRRDSGPVA